MKQLSAGEFHGKTNQTLSLKGKVITDTEYTQPKVDWHYHEHAYFTFILAGKVLEGNKKETYHCTAGSLLFHHWQDPHYNIKPPGFTRGFHIELDTKWFLAHDLNVESLTGSFTIHHPQIKLCMYDIVKESKHSEIESERNIDMLLIRIFNSLSNSKKKESTHKPQWVNKIKEIVNESTSDSLSLKHLARLTDIHPVHLSRDFHKYFDCNLGEYTRKKKIEKAISLLMDPKKNLLDIAYECGFADQSHFIRNFKKEKGLSPLAYRKLL